MTTSLPPHTRLRSRNRFPLGPSGAALALLITLGIPGRVLRAADIAPGIDRFLTTYCVRCHGPEKQKGSQRFDTLSRTISDAAVAQSWQDVLDTLNLSEMPPPDEKQPGKQELTDVLETLTANLTVARRRLVDSGGAIVVRRLNRREYQQTIRDLFGVAVDSGFLPEDEKIDGFDTLGQAQEFSSLHLERYLELGKRVLNRVIVTGKKPGGPQSKKVEFGGAEPAFAKEAGNLDKTIAGYTKNGVGKKRDDTLKFTIAQHERRLIDEYRARPSAQTGALIPFRGIRPWVDYNFGANPTPGFYRVRVRCGVDHTKPQDDLFLRVVRGNFRAAVPDAVEYYQVTGTVAAPQVIEFTIELDGGIRSNRLAFERRNGRRQKVAGLEKAQDYYFVFPRIATLLEDQRPDLWIDAVEVEGPVPQPAPPLAASVLFAGRDPAKLVDADARGVVERFAFQAFRRQTPDPAYIDKLMEIFTGGRAHGASFTDALKDTLAVVLASPRFLYLYEPRPEGQAPRALSDRELAIRLSYFLWSAPPDEELWRVAESGTLRQPAVLTAQLNRLIASPRSEVFVETFLTGWLELHRLTAIDPATTHADGYDDAAQQSTRRETLAFFHTLLRDNLPIHALITSDFVTVDSIAARFYGLPGVMGDGFRKVTLPAGSVRGGLLGQSAILTLTGTGDRTSPVERGVFVLRKILDRPPPPAPANVPMLDEKQVGTRSIRDTLDQHMTKAQCQSCHRRIDPLGFALERFDPVGLLRDQVRSEDGAQTFPIVTAGVMPDGKRSFAGYPELRQRLMEDRDQLVRVLTRNLMTYALGRTIGFTDQDTVEQLVAATIKDGYGLGALVRHLVQSKAFQTK